MGAAGIGQAREARDVVVGVLGEATAVSSPSWSTLRGGPQRKCLASHGLPDELGLMQLAAPECGL